MLNQVCDDANFQNLIEIDFNKNVANISLPCATV
jgi:hypothetical protein